MKRRIFPILAVTLVLSLSLILLWSSPVRDLQAQEGGLSERMEKLEVQFKVLTRQTAKLDVRIAMLEEKVNVLQKGSAPKKVDDRERLLAIRKNESSALGTLKMICTGQEQFRSANCVDQNRNGVGEYGFIEELAGHVKCRDAQNRQAGPIFNRGPYIQSILGKTDALGIASKSGYYFRICLPAKDGKGGTSLCTDVVNVPLAESAYVVYAWPMEAGVTGNRVFVIDPCGQPYCWLNSAKTYNGKKRIPAWDTAFNKPGTWADNYIDDAGPGQTGMKDTKWIPVG
ncbi:MAG: hypothetical protein ACYTHN_24135 [Planctomycetota bacterium]|jgi:hypothetical protein